MTNEEKIKTLAELDGWKWDRDRMWFILNAAENRYLFNLPDYLTSYDAIIPLIQKQSDVVVDAVCSILIEQWASPRFQRKAVFLATPAQLSDALLVATGKLKP